MATLFFLESYSKREAAKSSQSRFPENSRGRKKKDARLLGRLVFVRPELEELQQMRGKNPPDRQTAAASLGGLSSASHKK